MENRAILNRHHFHVDTHSVVVTFRFKVRSPPRGGGANNQRTSWRTMTMVIQTPRPAFELYADEVDDVLKREIVQALQSGAGQKLSGNNNGEENDDADDGGNDNEGGGGDDYIVEVNNENDVQILERRIALNHEALMVRLGLDSLPRAPQNVPMFGYLEEQAPKHRSFRYMIEGCDMKTLHPLVPDDWIHADCDRMCAYRMLSDLNTKPGHYTPPKIFRPEEINKWLNSNGHAVGGLCDGLTSDDIQAHAVQHRYGHCAMDLTRSILNLYIPLDRHAHHKTACYFVVGNHCQPIQDTNVVKSIMQSSSARLGRRAIMSTTTTTPSNSATTSRLVEASLSSSHHDQQRRKRRRSLDRVFRPEFDRSEERQAQDQWKANGANMLDITVDDWEEEFSDNGSQQLIPDTADIRKRIKLPLVTDLDRFHFFTRADNLDIVEAKCKPDYREGSDTTLIHYYICTDEDDVEFLYNYMVRVLRIDPLRYARTFNGRCRQIRMQNVWWCANRDIHTLMQVHRVFHPLEPLRVGGMATYAFRLLHQQLCRLTRKAGAIWECMSHYPPNLQRLMDTNHPFARPKLIQHTYQPPYSNPKDNNYNNNNSVSTLIPMEHRHRIDLIRSYASVIRNLKDDEFPIHDPTNRVVPFDEMLHGDIPIGHYLVDIPTAATLRGTTTNTTVEEDWQRLPCLPLGESRMMSHRMVRALLHRQMIQKNHIRLVCRTDPIRQNKYGMALLHALQDVLEMIYKHKDLQNLCPKHLINHLIGICNGTSLPHSGMRYVFQDINHLYNVLVSIVAEDQLRKVKVLHTIGFDTMWHKSFDYYEIDCSGMAYRTFHLQPVFHMVLEEQAIRVFDIARTIPLKHLIQINVDAIEYQWDPKLQPPAWARTIQDTTVDAETYHRLTPADLFDHYMGRFRSETPKDESKAITYYYRFNQAHAQTKLNQFWSRVSDTENTEWVNDWKKELRILETANHHQRTDSIIEQLLVDLFVNNDHQDSSDLSGLIVTGPAGTGKTHFIRRIQGFATNLGYNVVKTAFTHAACVQMGCDAITLSSLFGMDEKADMRCTMAMSRKFAAQLRNLNIDVLIVDEISMIPLILLEVLMMFHRVSSKTRICCFGDFHQLPPVEPHLERNDDSYNYFDNTDIFPYLVYDRVRNVPGRWLQLTECMRSTDPLMVRICQDPGSVQGIQPADFPMPSLGIPIWRFICWRNSTRKACNFYCMHRYLQVNPTVTRHRFVLRDIYAVKKLQEQSNKNKKHHEDNNPTNTTGTAAAYDLDYFKRQFESGSFYRPSHWNYLQSFTYAVNMEVVCRNTLKEWEGGGGDRKLHERGGHVRPECVNNRRAVITDIDTQQKTVTLRWVDVIRRFDDLKDQTDVNIEDFDVTLMFYDFAFNFVPGFCITAHMAQGETIREHYGILEWQEVATMPKMAYVAVTRGSSSEFLHIVPPYADPWNHSNDTSHLFDNVLTKLFHAFRWDKKQSYVLDVEDVITKANNTPCCTLCQVPLLYTRYSYKSSDQFAVMAQKLDSLSPEDCCIVCNACLSNHRKSRFTPPPPPLPAVVKAVG